MNQSSDDLALASYGSGSEKLFYMLTGILSLAIIILLIVVAVFMYRVGSGVQLSRTTASILFF